MKTCLLCESTSAGAAVTFRRRDICDWCDAELSRQGFAWCAAGRHKVAASLMRRTSSRCKPCDAAKARASLRDRRAYARAYREHRREQLAAYWRRPDVKARRNAARRAHYRVDPAPFKMRQRRYYVRHRDRAIAAQLRRYRSDLARHQADRRRRYVARKLQILKGMR